MLLDIEADQFLHRADGVERVEVQPLVLEHPPPGFDQGIGIRDFRASQNAVEQPRMDEFIDRPVDVLGASVGQHGGGAMLQALAGGEQDFGGGAGIEGGRDLPSQDAAREVVDHRVQIGAASIEQPDQRGVDVPDLIGARGPNPDLRLGRMNALPGPSPVVITDQAIPACSPKQKPCRGVERGSPGCRWGRVGTRGMLPSHGLPRPRPA